MVVYPAGLAPVKTECGFPPSLEELPRLCRVCNIRFSRRGGIGGCPLCAARRELELAPLRREMAAAVWLWSGLLLGMTVGGAAAILWRVAAW